MTTPPLVHGSFTIERTYAAPVSRVFAAWVDVGTKARWFIGPPDRWTLLDRALDLRVGGTEILFGQLTDGPTTRFVGRYHAIVPDRRLVYAYDMHVGDTHLSVSLASVELEPTRTGGTRMTFTEQATFLDGNDGTQSRETGTAAHFDRITPVVLDPHDIVSARTFAFARDRVYAAFADPSQLARWWGPAGFTNTIPTLDLTPRAVWRYTMHAPDGQRYDLERTVIDCVPLERIVLRNDQPVHAFTMTMTYVDLGRQTHLIWRMRFDDVGQANDVRPLIEPANEENFDRLAAHLTATV